MVPADAVGTVEGEISKDSILKVAIIAARIGEPIETGTLRFRTDDGILDLPTNCSSRFEDGSWMMTCISLVLSHQAKELALTKFVRLQTPSKNFDLKPGGQCDRMIFGLNKIGRDFYEATTGDTSLSVEYEREQEKVRLAEEAAARRKAEETRLAEEQAAKAAEEARKNEYRLIRTIRPKYPRKAQTYGIEGYVVVGYTVTKEGNVTDPIIIDGSSQGIFNQPAIEAVLQYKYKPRLVNGEPVDAPGARTTLTFEMAD